MLKKELRQKKILERKKITWWKRMIWNRQVYHHTIRFLKGQEKVQKSIAIFWSTKAEVDTHAIIRFLLKNHYQVSIATIDENYCMTFRKISDLKFIKEWVHGCCQPSKIYPIVPKHMIDLFFVPLVAFDHQKNRLGYGKGCFDRYLNDVHGSLIIGLAYSIQQCVAVPVESHDRKLSNLITNKGMI